MKVKIFMSGLNLVPEHEKVINEWLEQKGDTIIILFPPKTSSNSNGGYVNGVIITELWYEERKSK